ncbi:FadR/GntR family transcriptional regulator [Pseudomonas oryzihabitans]|uniref:FadR/GntR family transcriptional regulator n=1 Tax=Pseudomonas oryzihabitans TaxID=47885 RepID=UPI00135D5EEA|nr:FadR/GntR family transcriptional regulator [Pseudomonas oryzihabitans]MXS19847.1 FCD domain-containing protein [Pseudomonas oryzihabitans]
MNYKTPLPRKSRHARIVHELGTQIVSGQFLPEQRLPPESQLCEDYEVSRPVLREATRVLVAKGLVRSKPKVGTVVKPRNEWHLLDPDVLHWLLQSDSRHSFFETLVKVRNIIEPEVAAMAAANAQPEDLTAIEEAYERMEQAEDLTAMAEPDMAFHLSIANATHNELLIHLYSIMLIPVRDYLERSAALFKDESLGLLVPRHKAILTAIQHRDPICARHAAIAQLAGVDDLVTETFRTDPLSAKDVSYDH